MSAPTVQRHGNKAKQAQAMSKRFNESDKYSSEVSEPFTLAKTGERYITAVEELEIDKSGQSALLHHILKCAANVFYRVSQIGILVRFWVKHSTCMRRGSRHIRSSNKCGRT
jgi:hypothetical protein